MLLTYPICRLPACTLVVSLSLNQKGVRSDLPQTGLGCLVLPPIVIGASFARSTRLHMFAMMSNMQSNRPLPPLRSISYFEALSIH
ncbi:hypothetical protein BDW67DRAFT_155124 [Aspergillus spinulosporus]